MIERLNAWQRLWLAFAGVFLASTIALIAAAWPKVEPGVVADLRAPECAEWRNMPEALFPDRAPASGAPCHALRSFLYQERITLRSEDDYRSYLTRSGTKSALVFLAAWAVFAGGIYVLGWSSRRLVTRFQKRRGPEEKQRVTQ
jgi:hypothetical protein